VGVSEAGGRLIELGERERRLQAETARALLPRNFNCSKKRGFRSSSVRTIRREQPLAKEPLQERVENPLPRVSGQPLSLPYAAQRSIRFVLSELNFGETSEEKGQIESMPLFRKGGEALTKLGEGAIAAFEARSRPGRDCASRAEKLLDSVLPAEVDQREGEGQGCARISTQHLAHGCKVTNDRLGRNMLDPFRARGRFFDLRCDCSSAPSIQEARLRWAAAEAPGSGPAPNVLY